MPGLIAAHAWRPGRYWEAPEPPPAGDPAPVAAAYTTGTGSTVAAVTCNKPTGTIAGDLLAFFGLARDATATAEYSRSGWTKVDPTGIDRGVRVTPLWKVADAGDAAASSFEFTASGTTESAGGILVRITGAAASGHFAAAAELMTAAGTPYDPPASGTVAAGNYLCLAVVGMAEDAATTVPADYTKEVEILHTPGRDFTLVVASKALSGAMAEDPGSFSSAQGTVDNHCWTILIAP